MNRPSLRILIFLIVMTSLIQSCNRPECKNTNPVFDAYSPETKEYKDELIKRLKLVDNSKLSYWLYSYQEENNSVYLNILIQGESLCAKAHMLIKEWDGKLEGIHKAKGIGYNGAELVNLNFDDYQDSARTEIVYKSVDAVVD